MIMTCVIHEARVRSLGKRDKDKYNKRIITCQLSQVTVRICDYNINKEIEEYLKIFIYICI